MTVLEEIIARGRIVAEHRPFARAVVDVKGWRAAITALESGRVSLLSLWGEPQLVHMALLEANSVGVVSLSCRDSFPSVGAHHAPAIRFQHSHPASPTFLPMLESRATSK